MKSHLKELVHARMQKTGESYQQALRHVRAQDSRAPASVERTTRTRSIADTAFSIAQVRADESMLPPASRLFDDPFAHLFAAAGAHAAESTQRFLDLPYFRDGVRLRTRFIDDAVRDAIASGIGQLVLLGAGFDSRGLRLGEVGARGVRVFEVDTKEQLARKKAILSTGKVKLPSHVVCVACNFDAADFDERLEGTLVSKGFEKGTSAMFVWEGVIGYIGNDAIDRTLRFMTRSGGPRTRAVFTYGENTFAPETAHDHTARAGFTRLEELTGEDLWHRYLDGPPHPAAKLMRMGVAIV